MKRIIAVLCTACLVFTLYSAAQAEFLIQDGAGQKLGVLLDTGSPLKIYVPTLQKVIALDPGSGDLSQTFLYYTTTNCSGQIYLQAGNNINHVYQDYVGNPYFNDGGCSGSSMTINSRRVQGGSCSQITINNYYCTATSFDTNTLPFTLPITMPYAISFQTRAAVIPMMSQ